MFLTLIYTERIIARSVLMLFLFGKYDYQSMLVFFGLRWFLDSVPLRPTVSKVIHKAAAETAAITTVSKSSHSILCLGETAFASAMGIHRKQARGRRHAAELGGGKL